MLYVLTYTGIHVNYFSIKLEKCVKVSMFTNPPNSTQSPKETPLILHSVPPSSLLLGRVGWLLCGERGLP